MAEVGLLNGRVDLRVTALALADHTAGGANGAAAVRRSAACAALLDDSRVLALLATLYASRGPGQHYGARRDSPLGVAALLHPLQAYADGGGGAAADPRATPGEVRAARDVARGDLVLAVPHLRFPWAADLAAAMWRTLGVRLDKRPSHAQCGAFRDHTGLLMALKVHAESCAADAEHPSRPIDDELADFFYPQLSPDDQLYNQVVAQHLHTTYGPGVVPKLANLARLTYVNAHLAEIRHQIVQSNSERDKLLRTLNELELKQSHHPSSSRSSRPKSTTELLPNPRQRSLSESVLPSSACSSARSSSPPVPGSPTSREAKRHSAPVPFSFAGPSVASSHSSFPRRMNIARSWFQLCAFPVADHPVSPHLSKFIINGVVVPGNLLTNIRDVLAREFHLDLAIGSSYLHAEYAPRSEIDLFLVPSMKLPPAESYSLLLDRIPASARSRSPLRDAPVHTRCSQQVLDAHLMDRFGMQWPAVCAHAVCVAELEVSTERLRKLNLALSAAGNAEDAAQQVRQDLVATAVAFEVANAPLSRKCALRLAQKLTGPEINAMYMSLPREVWRLVAAARDRLEELENVESVSLISLTI